MKKTVGNLSISTQGLFMQSAGCVLNESYPFGNLISFI